jgi:hypothetical protein
VGDVLREASGDGPHRAVGGDDGGFYGVGLDGARPGD